MVDVRRSHCWSDKRTESLPLALPSFTLVLYIQNHPGLMEKVKDIDLDRDKDRLTICILISQVLKAICYQPDLITKSYKLPNYQLVSS